MTTYIYQCSQGHFTEDKRLMSAPFIERVECDKCHRFAEWSPQVMGIKFTPTIGRDSGVYALDYGRRATEDLTVPGKLERLRNAGTIADPFLDHSDAQRKGDIPTWKGPNVDL